MTKSRDLANAATALNAVTATELGYVDGVTSAIQTQLDAKLASSTAATTYVANALADAKGDIFVASADNTVTRLPVGSTGDTIVADSSTATGLRYSPTMAAGKNYCINGAFDIWQRGTTFTNPGGGSGTYTADRWTVYFNGNGTITQETSVKPDTSTYALKVTATASSGGNDVYQLVEQLNMEQFRGKSVTLSVKVAGTATLAPGLGLAYSTTANDTLTNTSTAIAATIVANPTINASTFVTYISQFTVPTTAKTLRIQLSSAAMANTNVLYWAEAQLEIGSTATAFSRAGGTIQGELAACQRYYRRLNAGTAYGTFKGVGVCTSTTKAELVISLDIELRTNPSFASSGSFQVVNGGASTSTTSLASGQLNTTSPQIEAVVASGLTTGFGAYLRSNNSTASYLEFSSEL